MSCIKALFSESIVAHFCFYRVKTRTLNGAAKVILLSVISITVNKIKSGVLYTINEPTTYHKNYLSMYGYKIIGYF